MVQTSVASFTALTQSMCEASYFFCAYEAFENGASASTLHGGTPGSSASYSDSFAAVCSRSLAQLSCVLPIESHSLRTVGSHVPKFFVSGSQFRGTGILHDLSQSLGRALHTGEFWNCMGGDSAHPTDPSNSAELLYAVTAGISSRFKSSSRSFRMPFSPFVVSYSAEGWLSCATHFWYSLAPKLARACGTPWCRAGRICIDESILMPSAREACRSAMCLD
jgi:hypothetical protein